MPAPSQWDVGLWDEARWSYVTLDAPVVESQDITNGGIAVINPIGGLATENPDEVVGAITTINHLTGDVSENQDETAGHIISNQGVFGDITENPDEATGQVSVVNFVSGDITENQDLVTGEVNQIIAISGDITNGNDEAYGTISLEYPIFGDITENQDIVGIEIGIIVNLFGAITENRDIVRGNFKTPETPRKSGADPDGNWAPQFYYKREWEIEPEPVVAEVEEVIDFTPTPLPLDPAVIRILQNMMRPLPQVSTDEDDLEAILMDM